MSWGDAFNKLKELPIPDPIGSLIDEGKNFLIKKTKEYLIKKAGEAYEAIKKRFKDAIVDKVNQICAEAKKEQEFKKAISNIKIKGDDKFKKKVKEDLRKIYDTPTGKKLLESLKTSGKKVTITKTTKGNACSYSSPNDRFYKSDGTSGKGTDSTVKYNPNRKKLSGTEKWATRPPAIGLAHELIHAEQAAYGTQSQGKVKNDARKDPSDPTKFLQTKKREAEAVGIPPNDKRNFTENKIRAEWKPPQSKRTYY